MGGGRREEGWGQGGGGRRGMRVRPGAARLALLIVSLSSFSPRKALMRHQALKNNIGRETEGIAHYGRQASLPEAFH
jgi:hypothetical protein